MPPGSALIKTETESDVPANEAHVLTSTRLRKDPPNERRRRDHVHRAQVRGVKSGKAESSWLVKTKTTKRGSYAGLRLLPVRNQENQLPR